MRTAAVGPRREPTGHDGVVRMARCGAAVAMKRSMARGKVQSGQGKPAERGKAKGQSRAPLKVKYNIPGRELSA
jgi:hypothetical protein